MRSRQPVRLFVFALGLAAALALSACSLASEPIPAGPIETGPAAGEEVETFVPASLPVAAGGAALYAENCAACHGEQGAADGSLAAEVADAGGVLPNFSDPDLARARSPQEWFEIITNGRMSAMMPPWGGMLDEEARWNLTYYLYGFSTSPDALAEGEALYAEHFAGSLGEHGEAAGLDDPAAIAALSPAAIVSDYLSDVDSGLSDDELFSVAAYVQTFGYDAETTPEDVAAAVEAEQAAAAAAEPAAEGEAEATDEAGAAGVEMAPGTGIVEGKVTVGSPGFDLPEGLEVNLTGVELDANNQVSEFLSRSAPVQPDGSYRFDDLPFDRGEAAYVVEVIYDGMTFSNGQIIDPEVPSLSLPVMLYASTTDDSVISLDAMHLVLNEHPDTLLVTAVYVFSNTSDRMYVSEEPVSGGRRGSVAIELPPDAYGVTFEEGQLGGRFVQVDNLIYDTQQVLPGTQSHAIIMTYFLPFDGPRDVALPLRYNTGQVTLLAQDGQTVRSDVLSEAGSEVIGDVAYDEYIAQGLQAGTLLDFRVQHPVVSADSIPLILGGAAAVLLAVGIAFWLIQRRRQTPEPVEAGFGAEAEALLQEIAALDDAFETGQINRLDYEARRAELKAELAAEMGQAE